MRVLCPSCQQLVTVPDASAGQSTPCPQCGKVFTPPALTGAALDAAPPPPLSPPRNAESIRIPDTVSSAGSVAPPVAPSTVATARSCTCALHKNGIRWVAPVALFAAFLLS